ncbi:MAG TPA: DUF4339 domain-containing protein [Chitinophagaceae bacterium]|nr:DUF4339 domain-containing protein [Chitinophagaceae bacterium]MCC6634950.1 DUF4339 domain-containing protein [Chitinophagaceae bacterium]HMZ47129.1 DUF4339 domain-containing protein [Chitinophagaceae bacterium]HNE93419.1 DUF4339 domain-containing protein [Chitinophagaceae bacterium]HNF28926.1 DUF4339 domain-containing protein [Chitinophagaceae bacterium]
MEENEKIYILKKKKYIYGPYNFETLKQNNLKAGDMIWYEGLKDWVPVEEIEGLASFIISDNTNNNGSKKSFFKKILGL